MSRRVGLGQRGPRADDPEDQEEASPLSQLIDNDALRGVVANVVAYFDCKSVEAFSTLCHAAATDGPRAWWRSTLETWITNSCAYDYCGARAARAARDGRVRKLRVV